MEVLGGLSDWSGVAMSYCVVDSHLGAVGHLATSVSSQRLSASSPSGLLFI